MERDLILSEFERQKQLKAELARLDKLEQEQAREAKRKTEFYQKKAEIDLAWPYQRNRLEAKMYRRINEIQKQIPDCSLIEVRIEGAEELLAIYENMSVVLSRNSIRMLSAEYSLHLAKVYLAERRVEFYREQQAENLSDERMDKEEVRRINVESRMFELRSNFQAQQDAHQKDIIRQIKEIDELNDSDLSAMISQILDLGK